MSNNKKEDNNVKVWGEHINIKQFLIGLFCSLTFLIVTILITNRFISNQYEVKLIVGLIAVLIVFIFNLIFIEPKRNLIVKEQLGNDN